MSPRRLDTFALHGGIVVLDSQMHPAAPKPGPDLVVEWRSCTSEMTYLALLALLFDPHRVTTESEAADCTGGSKVIDLPAKEGNDRARS